MTPEINNVVIDDPDKKKEYSSKKLLTEKEIKKSVFYLVVKRILDILFSLLGLIVLAIPFVILSVVIFIDDPHGSPFYSQPRVGRNGKVFRFWKFRSMVVGADKMVNDLQDQNEKDGPVFKIKDDPRITNIGKFIRKTSIDELPQLWNVLKGDMSIVGPRPPLPREVEMYGEYERQRLLITPGLTCYWQACNGRDDVGFDEWVDMDIKYIRNRGFVVDMELILRTVAVVFTGQGS